MLQKDEGENVNSYEAIFVRKSVRSYKMEPIASSTIDKLKKFYENVQKLFLGIETEISIIENLEKSPKAGLFSVKAPYYLALYSEEQDKAMMNAGYIVEQLSLYLCTQGIGSCIIGGYLLRRAFQVREGKKLMILLAFGKSRGSCVRKRHEEKRLDLKHLCVYKETPRQWMHQLLEAARLAPSSYNCQPWRFLVYDNRIHVFAKNAKNRRQKKFQELNFGILLSHMMVAAEELWLDVDFIRLEDISQKSFSNSQYVLSTVMNA